MHEPSEALVKAWWIAAIKAWWSDDQRPSTSGPPNKHAPETLLEKLGNTCKTNKTTLLQNKETLLKQLKKRGVAHETQKKQLRDTPRLLFYELGGELHMQAE